MKRTERQYSLFGGRFARPTGTRSLMDDLEAGIAGERSLLMLGGGNPARIPAMHELFAEQLRRVAADDVELGRMLEDYSSPQGERRFIAALAELLAREYGWPVAPANIALTSGSQTGFFMLFNLLAGEAGGGVHRKILLPLTPEYIGYNDIGLTDDFFIARRPRIEFLVDRHFKYRVDFDTLEVGPEVGAICVSRPTNPTGNVLTDDEISKLARLAATHGVPLIIDNAYGTPFPHIVFTDAKPFWDENIIVCLSLSKLGLPGVRTGIVIAEESIIDALINMNAVMNLAVGNVGPVLLEPLVRSGEIIRISREVIAPFYRARAELAVEWLQEALDGCDYYLHTPEGSMFLWLWLPSLPVSSEELYQRLKERGVLVLSGHHFFPGLTEDWPHRRQCLRINYSQPAEVVQAGVRIIAEEVRSLSGTGTRRAAVP